MLLALVLCGSNQAVVFNGHTVCTYDPHTDDAGCLDMLSQVVHSLAAIHAIPYQTLTVDAPFDNWTWSDVITSLDLSPSSSSLVHLSLNEFDSEGCVCDSHSILLSENAVSDIVNHAAQLAILKRANADDDAIEQVSSELDAALSDSGVIFDV